MASSAASDRETPVAAPVRHAFTVDDYYRLAEIGVLPPGQRTELIDGDVIDMTPIGSRHAACVTRLQRAFAARLGDRADVRVQLPVRLDAGSEPEPDLAIVARRTDDYEAAHPTPTDVLLLVEVSDTTLTFDRTVKASLYARAGITEYWLVDIVSRSVEVHRSPGAGRYTDVSRATTADAVSPTAFPDVRVEVAALFGGAAPR
jgi:hypothetical protein